MLNRCLPAALLAATLLPATVRAEPVTIGVHSLDGSATTSLLATLSPESSIGEITLPEAGTSVNIMFDGLAARENYQMELLVNGSGATWDSLRMEVLDPLDEDDLLDVMPYHSGVPDGFSTSNTRDGLSFAQSSGLERSAEFAGGSATLSTDEDTDAADGLLFSGLGAADGAVRVTFGLRDFDGNRSFLVRLTAEDPLGTPEPVSMLLVGTGLAGLAVVRRRRQGPSGPSNDEGYQ